MPNWRNTDFCAEFTLALVQAKMDRALTDSRMTEEAMAAQGHHVDHLLSSDCDLTVRILGSFLALCGYRLNVGIQPIPAAKLPSAPVDHEAAWNSSHSRGVSRLPAPLLEGALVPTIA